MIRIILVLTFLILFLTLGLPVLFFGWLIKGRTGRATLEVSTAMVHWAFGIVLRLSGTDVTVEGREHIPDSEAVLYVGNHRSYFDIISTYAQLKAPAGFIAKAEMSRIPLLRFWMAKIGCLFLNRDDIKQGLKTIMDAIAQIKGGVSVIIYPEGTRNRNEDPGELLEFHEGSLKIAQKSGCRIVPVAIYGTDDIFEKHMPMIRKKKIVIRFGEPFYSKEIPEEYKKKHGLYLQELISSMIRDIERTHAA